MEGSARARTVARPQPSPERTDGRWRMASEAEVAAMRRAIALSASALGRTAPNPTVGCVILDAAGEVVGEGCHVYAGVDHAEVVALRAAGERARGGTAVVTLSPCTTAGRTGPCADALRA